MVRNARAGAMAVGLTLTLSLPGAGAAQAGGSAVAQDPSCAPQVTPGCVQQLYGIPTARLTQSSNHITVIVPSVSETQLKRDVAMFLRDLRPDLNPAPEPTVQRLGDAGREPDLGSTGAVEWAMGLASGAPVTVVVPADPPSPAYSPR